MTRSRLPTTVFPALSCLGHPLFFPHLLSNAFPDIGSVGQIEKEKLKKKSQEVLE